MSPTGMPYVLQAAQQRKERKQQQRLGGQREVLLQKMGRVEGQVPPQLPNFRHLHRYAEWYRQKPLGFAPVWWRTIEKHFLLCARGDKEKCWRLLYEYVRWAKALHKLDERVLSPAMAAQFLRRRSA